MELHDLSVLRLAEGVKKARPVPPNMFSHDTQSPQSVHSEDRAESIRSALSGDKLGTTKSAQTGSTARSESFRSSTRGSVKGDLPDSPRKTRPRATCACSCGDGMMVVAVHNGVSSWIIARVSRPVLHVRACPWR